MFAIIDKKPQGKTCAAIIGIIEEGAEIMQEYKGSPALDAGLLAAAQAVEYYQISRYGTLRTRAEEFGLDDTASLFRETPSGLLRAFFSDSPTQSTPFGADSVGASEMCRSRLVRRVGLRDILTYNRQ